MASWAPSGKLNMTENVVSATTQPQSRAQFVTLLTWKTLFAVPGAFRNHWQACRNQVRCQKWSRGLVSTNFDFPLITPPGPSTLIKIRIIYDPNWPRFLTKIRNFACSYALFGLIYSKPCVERLSTRNRSGCLVMCLQRGSDRFLKSKLSLDLLNF